MDRASRPTLALLVGLQGSGKSTFARALEGFVHVSNDHAPNHRDKRARLLRLVTEALSAGRSVVVDNTSPAVEDRAPLLAIARALEARCVAYFFDTPLADCLARNARREGRARVPEVALFATRKRLVVPSRGEGLDEVLRVASGDAGVRVEPLAPPQPSKVG